MLKFGFSKPSAPYKFFINSKMLPLRKTLVENFRETKVEFRRSVIELCFYVKFTFLNQKKSFRVKNS